MKTNICTLSKHRPKRKSQLPSEGRRLKPPIAALILTAHLLLAWAVFQQVFQGSAFAAVATKDYEKAVAVAEAALIRGDHSKAANVAKEITLANQDRYEAFLTAGLATRLQAVFAELDDKAALVSQATENLQKALALLHRINATALSTRDLDFATHLDAAWKADADNLVAKAATEYEAAFLARLGDANAAFGAMVAFKRTMDYGKAEKYARVLLGSLDKKLVQQAKLELPKLREIPPQVTNAIAGVRNLLDQGHIVEAEAKAREHLAKMPFLGELHFLLGFSLARRGEVQPAIASFKEAVKQGFGSESDFVHAAEIPSILRNEPFLTLVTDAIGDTGRKSVLDLWDKKEALIRRETRAKFDTSMAAAHEAIGRQDLASARAEALKSKALMPDDPAVQKVMEEIDTAEYTGHLISAQDALLRRDFELAKAEALKAQKLRSTEHQPSRLLQAIDTAARLERLTGFLKDARDALSQKQFQIATSKTKQALDMVPDNGEAKALLLEVEQAIKQDKVDRAERLISQARSVYHKDQRTALSALDQALQLTEKNQIALTLRAEVEAFWTHVAELRSKLTGIKPQKPQLSALEAISELRALFPDDGELQTLWNQHCTFVNSIGMRFLFVSPPPPLKSKVDNGVERGFFMAQLEATENQWENIMGRNSLYSNDKVWNSDGTYYQPGMDHPVCQITAAEAVLFCDKLSAREGRSYRLPTVHEWEYTCTFGDAPLELSNTSLIHKAWFFFNCQRDGQNYPHTVGQKQPNALGLHDMLGNVAEWCTPTAAGTNLAEHAVLKGGSWKDPATLCNPKAQQRLQATQREKWAGMRVLLQPEE